MKKTVAFTLLLSCILACLSFAGCDLFKNPGNDTPDVDTSPAYELRFTSNGDGTCYVSQIATRPNVSELYTVEIPETSPEGDRVVAVDPIVPLRDTVLRNVPNMILVEDFDAICNTVKQNGISDFDYAKLTAFFIKFSTEGCSEQEKAELIEVFPYTEFVDIYVLDQEISEEDWTRVSNYLIKYADYDENARYQTDQKLGQIIEEHGLGDALDISDYYTAFMEKLVLPASVTLVNLPTSSFDQIIYAGTIAQWESVSYELNTVLGTKVMCADGEVNLAEYLVTHGVTFEAQFLCGISEDIVVTPETPDGTPLQAYSVVLGEAVRLDEYFMLKSDYENLLAKMEQEGYESVAEKHRGNMEVRTIGSVEYVPVPNALINGFGYAMPKSYYGQKMMEFCEKTRIALTLKTLNSEHFVGLALPKTLQSLSLYVRSEEIYLADIYFDGTMEEWKQVKVVQYYFPALDLSYITVHCTDGDVPLAVEHIS